MKTLRHEKPPYDLLSFEVVCLSFEKLFLSSPITTEDLLVIRNIYQD